MNNIKEVNILELAKGAIQEQINGEVDRVMANILDPNTDAKATRKLSITLTFKPNENREVVSCSAQAKSTIAPIKAITTSIFVEADKSGKPRASELTKNDPNQLDMFEENQVTNVLKLRSV